MYISVAFWLFAALTALFALAFLWRLIPRPIPPANPELANHVMALRAVAAAGTDTESVTAIADAIATALKALGDFGSKLDTLGPTALLGIFTVFFALLAFASAWAAHH